ncbi:MAG: SBBP repeat-containing protein, partial [Candidatus Thorarchaeota archaeon]
MKTGKVAFAFLFLAVLSIGLTIDATSLQINPNRENLQSQVTIPESFLYSTYFGGDSRRSFDDRGADTCIGPNGDIYCLIWTTTHYWPLVNAYQDTFQGGYSDMVLVIMSSDGDTYQYCSFLGGNGDDYAIQMEVDSEGFVYLAGRTNSTNLASVGAYDETINGEKDIFVMKFDPSANEMVFSTYVGGSDNDEAWSIDIDSQGNSYVTGVTSSQDFPISNGLDNTLNGTSDAFALKLNSDGSDLVFSTYLGGNNRD